MRLTACLRVGCCWLALLAQAAGAPSCDRAAASEPVRLDHVSDRLDIVLVDGRQVAFPMLEPPRATAKAPQRPHETALELTSLLRGQTLLVLPLGPTDRWGRLPARIFVESSDEAADETLAAAGLAMASADPGACGAGALAAEQAARAARLGLWADPDFAVLATDDPAAFAARAGTLAIVEGRIRSVGRAGSRIYLNLAGGSPGGRSGGVSLVLARRSLPAFENAGFSLQSLPNRRIRARGVVEIGAAPQIELFHPGQIEFMEEAPRPDGARRPDSPGRN
ncbi:thermonuclease family protein [Rhodoblastus sp.]|uniref:thermonuclease family protein n=1 Tax=Rhodoblastus sp. TaxID=1962975 RepID=UPI0035B44F4F